MLKNILIVVFIQFNLYATILTPMYAFNYTKHMQVEKKQKVMFNLEEMSEKKALQVIKTKLFVENFYLFQNTLSFPSYMTNEDKVDYIYSTLEDLIERDYFLHEGSKYYIIFRYDTKQITDRLSTL